MTESQASASSIPWRIFSDITSSKQCVRVIHLGSFRLCECRKRLAVGSSWKQLWPVVSGG